MITIRFAGGQDGSIGPCNRIGGGMLIGPSGYPLEWGSTLPLFLSPYAGKSLLTREEEVQFGFLHQGVKPWGKLKDKDVLHVDAHGTIDLSYLTYSTRNNDDPGTGGFYNNGKRFTIGANVYAYDGNIVMWGTDASGVNIINLPLRTHPTYGPAVSCSPMTQEWSVKFDGDYAYYCSRIVAPYTITWASGNKYTPSGFPKILNCGIYQRVRSSSSVAYTYLSFLQYGTSQVYPYGYFSVKFNWNAVPPRPGAWFIYGGFTSAVTAAYNSLCSGSPVDFYSQQIEIVNRLKSPTLLTTVANIFANNPVTYDARELVTDIIHQHRLIDTNLILTLFDLAICKWESIPWQNLASLLSAGTAAVSEGITTAVEFMSSVKKIINQGSGLYLGIQYGVMPTWRDMDLVWKAQKKVIEFRSRLYRLHARHQSTEVVLEASPITSTETLTVEVDRLAEDFLPISMKAISYMWKRGLWPDLASIWDAMPWSFAINWFTHVSKAVDAADDVIWRKYFPIDHTIVSTKRSWSTNLQNLWPDLVIPNATITFTWYSRYCESELSLPPIQSGDSNGSFDHWAESVALIAQKMTT